MRTKEFAGKDIYRIRKKGLYEDIETFLDDELGPIFLPQVMIFADDEGWWRVNIREQKGAVYSNECEAIVAEIGETALAYKVQKNRLYIQGEETYFSDEAGEYCRNTNISTE